MQRRASAAVLVLVAVFAGASSPGAQATTGIIAGRVVSSDGQPLPGVTISTTSPALQGSRTAITSASGDYLITLLPPGTYSVSFDLGGFQAVKRAQQVAGAHKAIIDVTMSPSASEVVTVVGDAQLFVQTAQVATNFKQDLMAALPTNRTLDAVMLVAPGVHATGPGGANSVGGSLSYETVYTVNGAVIVENLRGSAYPLYIEDALQEVTVATAGISAEYGRFSGGMVSAVTKSGGDLFSGSLRTSFTNDYWRSLTPAGNDPKRNRTAPQPATTPMYEATFGGPIKKQRLWFFGATRIRNEEIARNTSVTNISYLRGNDEKRYEGKLTFAPWPNHSLQTSYIAIDQVQTNFTPQSIRVMDLKSLVVQRQPSDLLSFRYGGVVSPNFSVEVQYSSRHLTLDTGAPTRDPIAGTVLVDSVTNNRYWSPTFCGVCEDEKRDNDNFFAKGSYFLSTRERGAHHLVFGYDRFNDKVFQNAYQSGSNYRIIGNAIVSDDGAVYPQFLPNSTQIWYTPVETPSQGSNLRMHSLFANDTWRVDEHVSMNLGVRWDRNQAEDGGRSVVANRGLWSPRLSVVWDPKGDGRLALNASYSRYVMPMTSNVAASTTAAGNAALYIWSYQGPAVNPDRNAPLIGSDVAIEKVFQWVEAIGGLDPAKAGSFLPGFNIQIQAPLKSPSAREFAIGTSRQLRNRGALRVDGVWRTYHDFYSQRADLATKHVTDALQNRYDLFVVENTNDVSRRYSGLTAQAGFRIGGGFDVGGNYTLSRLWGNFDGESSAGPTVAQVNAYPEYKRREWNSPVGDLAADQRHRARFWGTFAPPLASGAGSLTLGLLQQIGSGVPYGAVGTINGGWLEIENPGYVMPLAPAGTVDYYFTSRDAFRTETTYRTDLSVNYAYRLRGGRLVQPELFFHGEVLNVFRDFQICGCGGSALSNGGATDLATVGQSVRTRRNTSQLSSFNPLTTTPVRGTHWEFNTNPGAEFGRPLSHLAYTTPRLARFSVGVRF